MLIRIKADFESSEAGVFTAGTERIVLHSLGSVFIARGLAEEVNPASASAKEKRKEVKENG